MTSFILVQILPSPGIEPGYPWLQAYWFTHYTNVDSPPPLPI